MGLTLAKSPEVSARELQRMAPVTRPRSRVGLVKRVPLGGRQEMEKRNGVKKGAVRALFFTPLYEIPR